MDDTMHTQSIARCMSCIDHIVLNMSASQEDAPHQKLHSITRKLNELNVFSQNVMNKKKIYIFRNWMRFFVCCIIKCK